MIKPPPCRLVCQKCNFSKIVRPKSDALNPRDFLSKCPKCDIYMERKNIDSPLDYAKSALDSITSIFK